MGVLDQDVGEVLKDKLLIGPAIGGNRNVHFLLRKLPYVLVIQHPSQYLEADNVALERKSSYKEFVYVV